MNFWTQLAILVCSVGISQYFIIKYCLKDIKKTLSEMKMDSKSHHERHEKRADHLYEICIGLLQTRR